MGLFDFFKKKKYQPETLSELKKLVEDPQIKLSSIDVSKVDDFSELFKNSTRTDFSGIESWDVSHVTNMRQCFYNAQNFNVDISKWNMSNVKHVSKMFAYAKNFSQDISGWDLSAMKGNYRASVINNMFKGATSFHKEIQKRYDDCIKENLNPALFAQKRMPFPLPRDSEKFVVLPNCDHDLSDIYAKTGSFKKIDTSSVSKINRFFKGAKNLLLKGLGLDDADLSNVKEASSLFENSDFNEPLPKMSNVKYADGILKNNKEFNQELPELNNALTIDSALEGAENFNMSKKPFLASSNLSSFDSAFSGSQAIDPEEDKMNSIETANLNRIKATDIVSAMKHHESYDFSDIDPDNNFKVVYLGQNTINDLIKRDPSIKGIFECSVVDETGKKIVNANKIGTNAYVISNEDLNRLYKIGQGLPNHYSGGIANSLKEISACLSINDFKIKSGFDVVDKTFNHFGSFYNDIFDRSPDNVLEFDNPFDPEKDLAAIKMLEKTTIVKRPNGERKYEVDQKLLADNEKLLIDRLNSLVKTDEDRKLFKINLDLVRHRCTEYHSCDKYDSIYSDIRNCGFSPGILKDTAEYIKNFQDKEYEKEHPLLSNEQVKKMFQINSVLTQLSQIDREISRKNDTANVLVLENGKYQHNSPFGVLNNRSDFATHALSIYRSLQNGREPTCEFTDFDKKYIVPIFDKQKVKPCLSLETETVSAVSKKTVKIR